MTRYFANCFRRNKTRLEYFLKKADGGLIFQIEDQSPDITTFLQNRPFMASNGMRITIDKYPEFKDSTNTIYLQGTDVKRNRKNDVTQFVSNLARDRKAEMIDNALAELVSTVKTWNNLAAPLYIDPTPSYNYLPLFQPSYLECYQKPFGAYNSVYFI